MKKWPLVCACLVALLALPATATSTTTTTKIRTLSGAVREGGSIDLRAKVEIVKGRYREEAGIRFRHVNVVSILDPQPAAYLFTSVPLTCDEGPFTTSLGWFWSAIPRRVVPVENNRFSERIPDDGDTSGLNPVARFKGAFTLRPTKVDRVSTLRGANGTFRQRFNYPLAGLTDCDTGTLHWRASAD